LFCDLYVPALGGWQPGIWSSVTVQVVNVLTYILNCL
jgi:hypothetical protein